jgi:CHAT domain-containing protein
MDSAVLLSGKGSDDGILSVKEILQLPPLKAKLVTLSACQTGRGKITGDGVAGLSRAFIIAGTPSVLVSLWNVDDVMTEFQMEAFYKDYLSGEHKARALRDAQLKTIAFMEKGLPLGTTAGGAKIRANPRYWAAFQLVGDSQ